MESSGCFVTYHHHYAQQQQTQGKDLHTAALSCPVCESKAAIVRMRRPRFRKLFTHRKLYLCRQCKTQFWH